MDYKEAIKLLENGEADSVKDYFKNNNFLLEYGYTLLLENDLDNAYKVLSGLTSPRAEWATTLISYFNDSQKIYPSFFQIRNFLEIDITLFFKYNLKDYIQILMNNANTFQSINAETYKFFGRVLLKHKYYQASKMFLDRSLEDYYNDTELHYLYAEFYLAHNDTENALKAVNTCLRINPNYFPAIKTYKELNNKVH